MSIPSLKIEKLVDHYFTTQTNEPHPAHPYSQHCPVCLNLNNDHHPDPKITRDDIDLL